MSPLTLRPGGEAGMFTRILLAIDGTESGHVAASFVSAMARQSGATVRVVHVNELLVGGRGFARATDKEAQRLVDDAVRTLVVAGVPATGELRVAYPLDVPRRIVDAAIDSGADMIVLGSARRRHRRLGRMLGGIVSHGVRERVTALTPLPLLTAPAPLQVSRRHALEPDELSGQSVSEEPSSTR
jgi:nucleotide-binding universal stress UspA family protein